MVLFRSLVYPLSFSRLLLGACLATRAAVASKPLVGRLVLLAWSRTQLGNPVQVDPYVNNHLGNASSSYWMFIHVSAGGTASFCRRSTSFRDSACCASRYLQRLASGSEVRFLVRLHQARIMGTCASSDGSASGFNPRLGRNPATWADKEVKRWRSNTVLTPSLQIVFLPVPHSDGRQNRVIRSDLTWSIVMILSFFRSGG